MILNKCFLYINGFPINASDIPYDVSIDWGDNTPLEEHGRIFAEVVPPFTHVYNDAEVHEITVQVKNSCGQAAQTVEYSPYVSYAVECTIENNFNQVNAVTDITDPFTLSVSSYVADLHKTSDGVSMKVIVDAACSLPYVAYPKKYDQYHGERFSVGSDRLTAENAVLYKTQAINNPSPYTAFTTIKGDPVNLIYEFPRQHIGSITLIGDYNLTQRLSYIDPDTNAPTLYTWAQNGDQYTLSLSSADWTNKDRIILYLQDGGEAALYSIVINNAQNTTIDKQSILVTVEVFFSNTTSESAMSDSGFHDLYPQYNTWRRLAYSDTWLTTYQYSATSPRTFISLTLTFYSDTVGKPQHLKINVATSCPNGESLYIGKVDTDPIVSPYEILTGSTSSIYNYDNRVEHTVYMEYIPDRIGKHTVQLVFASDPNNNGSMYGHAFFMEATFNNVSTTKISGGMSGDLIFNSIDPVPVNRIAILCDDNAKARLKNAVSQWLNEDYGDNHDRVNKGVIELNGDAISEYIMQFDGSAADGEIYEITFWYEMVESKYDSAITMDYAVTSIPNVPENLAYYTETNGTHHCVLVSSMYIPNNMLQVIATDTSFAINIDLLTVSGAAALAFTGNWDAACLMSIINALPVEPS